MKAEQTFEFDSIDALNKWFRQNVRSYSGYYFDQFRDESKNKWIVMLRK